MAFITINWPTFRIGRNILERGFRNGVTPPAKEIASMANYVNSMLANRTKILFHKQIAEADAYDTITQATTWRFQGRTSPNGTQVRARMLIAPSAVTGQSQPQGKWTVNGTDQTTFYSMQKIAATPSTPNDWYVLDDIWTGISGNTQLRCELTLTDRLKVLSATVYEVPRATLDTATDVAIDSQKFVFSGPIYDRDVLDIITDSRALFKQGGPNHFTWSVAATTANTTTSTSYVNVLDSSTSAWAAASPGWVTWPKYHGYIHTVSGDAETIPITFWAYLKTSNAAQAVTCILVDQNNGTGAPIATLTSTSTTGEYQSTTANWAFNSTNSMKLDAMFKIAGGAATASIYQCGVYEYEA